MNAPHLVSRLMFWTAALSVLSGCPMTTAPEEPVVEEPVPGCTDTRAANYAPAATEDDGSCVPVESSEAFLDHAQPAMVPGQFPSSNCTAITSHHDCVGTSGCGWLRTIKDDGVCRADPISRCLTEGDCVCDASDFHGDPAHDADLAVFLPLSIVAENLAETPFVAITEMEARDDESLINFTSRTDFSHKTLTVRAENEADVAGLLEAEALSLTLKFMHVWDAAPATISGTLLAGLGLSFELVEDQLSLSVGASGLCTLRGHARGGQHQGLPVQSAGARRARDRGCDRLPRGCTYDASGCEPGRAAGGPRHQRPAHGAANRRRKRQGLGCTTPWPRARAERRRGGRARQALWRGR